MAKRHPLNLPLKVAILDHDLTQRELAQRIGIPETRLSEIVRLRGVAASRDEQRRIARSLRQPIAALFPTPDAEVSE